MSSKKTNQTTGEKQKSKSMTIIKNLRLQLSWSRESGNTINERGTNSASSVCINILFLNLDSNYMGI